MPFLFAPPFYVLTFEQIAEQKMEDLNAATLEAAMKMVAGTARSMGVVVTGNFITFVISFCAISVCTSFLCSYI